jgi:hypothetical protein
MMQESSFPQKLTLWRGAILGGIANATMAARNATSAVYGYWWCNNYVMDDSAGQEAFITFVGGHWWPEGPLAALFHDVHSPRFRHSAQRRLEDYFCGCTEYQRSLAEAGARHMRLLVRGRLLHRLTAAFWDNGEFLGAAEPWAEVLANGASILETELIDDIDTALGAWEESYQMSVKERSFVGDLFKRKSTRPGGLIYLGTEDIEWLKSLSGNADAFNTCRESLSAMGIVFSETAR